MQLQSMMLRLGIRCVSDGVSEISLHHAFLCKPFSSTHFCAAMHPPVYHCVPGRSVLLKSQSTSCPAMIALEDFSSKHFGVFVVQQCYLITLTQADACV